MLRHGVTRCKHRHQDDQITTKPQVTDLQDQEEAMFGSKKLMAILGLAVMAALVGCSNDWKCKVESDTAWRGHFENRTVEGVGDSEVDIPDDPGVCVSVSKLTDEGYVTIQLVAEDGIPLVPDKSQKKWTTKARGGNVSDCIRD